MRGINCIHGLVWINTVWCATLEVGSGKNFTTITEAYTQAAEGDTILVSAGTYQEKLIIEKNNITMKGPTFPSTDPAVNQVMITAATFARDVKNNDASATLLVTASSFSLYNINIANTAGAGNDSQAVALANKGTQNAFYAASVIGFQDTLYAHSGSSFYGSCYVEGAVDFVFGIDGQAWFQGAKLAVLKKKGTVTAQGRTREGPGMIVFDRANITTGPTAATGTAGTNFLGRPLGNFSQTVFQNSDLGGMIAPEGWEVFKDGQDTSKVLAGEFMNTNTAAATNKNGTRAAFAMMISKPVTIGDVLPGYQSWVDERFLNCDAPS